MMRLIQLIIFLIIHMGCLAQTAIIKGNISNARNEGIDGVVISVQQKVAISDEQGNYMLSINTGNDLLVSFTHISFEVDTLRISVQNDDTLTLNRTLILSKNQLNTVVLEDERERETGEIKVDPSKVKQLPSASESVEALIATLPGVNSNNELSSQYNVRGGNFDENLVYVNDIQVYRPFLVRNGQQEGLSFINPDLVHDIRFSAGGFEARYGDKMSSVLDIEYKEPKKFGASLTASLMGGSVSVEGAALGHRINYIMGFRHRTTRLLLNSLDTEADYRPSFTDFQTYLTYHISNEWKLNFLGNLAVNSYQYIPKTRQTEFGTVTQALRLTVYFDGQEIDDYQTGVAALNATFTPNSKTELKWLFSGFRTSEAENFDIQGQYFIGELDNNLGSENFGEVTFNRGVGTYINHARNDLFATVLSIGHKGKYIAEKAIYKWGIKFNLEEIEDRFTEWTMIDSAGFSLPSSSNSDPFELFESLKTNILLQSNRTTAYLQRNARVEKDFGTFTYTTGVRAHYWSVNKEVVISPRITSSFKPNWKHDFVFRAASGFYYQPPFYREIRDFDGVLNKDVKAQQSIHFVLGGDYRFKKWERPFKLVTELYYKDLNNLVPYQVDNLRIRYHAVNNASGRAYGLDMKLNGEFVKGIDSWASLSIMHIEEDIQGDFYFDASDSTTVYPGYIPRPTDQTVSFSLYFQDYLPSDPTFTVNLGLHFATGLPFGPPKSERFQQILRTPPYRRVDIGFSKVIKSPEHPLKKFKFLNKFESIWFTLEVFNLLKINNTVSYIWVRDVTDQQFAVPNFLTSRLVNAKLKITL